MLNMKYTGGISIVIPIYNESKLLIPAITTLVQNLKKEFKYEILLVENGSKDDTYHLARQLTKKYKSIQVFRLTTPCYGAALKQGIVSARFPITIQFDLDLIDLTFLRNAVALLQVNDVVVGSKMLPGSRDGRAPFRYLASKITNFLLQKIFSYKGTDTHGIKAYKTKKIASITKKLKPTHLFFDTEILLIAEKQGLSIVELPVSIHNLRPTRFNTKIILFQLVKEFLSLISKKKLFAKQEETETHFTADDYNLESKVNLVINALIHKQTVSKVSILPNIMWGKKIKGAQIALHLNLIEGKPILSPEQIPSLVDKNGVFYSFPMLYMRLCLNLVRFSDLSNEIEAQIKLINKQYGKIYEINSHQHTHTLYPIDRMVEQYALKYSIHQVRRYGSILHYSIMGYIMHYMLFILSTFEHLMYGITLSQSPTWRKGHIPISFMSWEPSYKVVLQKVEVVLHPGTEYDRNKTIYTSLSGK